MKIKRGGEVGLRDQQAVELKRRGRDVATDRNEQAGRNSGSGTVDIGLARAINEQLDAEKLEEERQEKVERLKAAIKKGEYDPPVDKVANAVGREVVLEILSHGGAADDSED